MKFIKKARLTFREGNSDKVYEVDLCEQLNEMEARFLVNFRYGRRGTLLREGTKTPQPVTLGQAERLFNSVVLAKTSKGYIECGDARPAVVCEPKPVFSSADLRAFLTHIDEQTSSEQRARLIWRLPQQPDPELAAWLEQGLTQGHWLETYARLWGLGRTGSGGNLAGVKPCLYSSQDSVRDLAHEVWLQLADDGELDGWRRANLAALPASLVSALADNDDALLGSLLAQEFARAQSDRNVLLRHLYLAALDSACLQRCLLRQLEKLPLEPGVFKGVRYLFKMAEFRLDDEMFALLSYRFETTAAFFRADYDWHYFPKTGGVKVSEELKRPDSRLAYSQKTRDYLRRRSWRALKRLGLRGDERYVTLAMRLLQRFSDRDCREERRIERSVWDPERRRYRTHSYHYDGYAGYLAFNAILRTADPQYQRNLRGTGWLKTERETFAGRGEAFASLWDRQPERLLELLITTRASVVGEFSVRALQDNPGFCASINEADILQLLASPLTVANEFTLQLLATRPLSTSLLIALLGCANDKALSFALRHLQQMPTPFGDDELVVALLCIDNGLLRQWIQEQVARSPFNRAQRLSLCRLLPARLLMPGSSLSEVQAGWLADLLSQALKDEMRSLPFVTLVELLAQPDPGVRLLAARLLVVNQVALRDIPETALKRIHQSDSAAVRACGIALLSKLSVRELLYQLSSLVDLVYQGEELERTASFELLQKLSVSYSREVFGQLLPLVFKEQQQPGQQQALLAFIDRFLSRERDALDKDSVWRLIQARSVAAQQLGAQALRAQRPLSFSVRQWVAFADNPNREVRLYAHRAWSSHLSTIKGSSREALKLLESRWPDSQQFGFDFFRQSYHAGDWSPELIVSLCDSNLPKVQAYGRELLHGFFQQEQGEEYLLKLSQHPSATVQAFVTGLLDDYASGKPQVILALQHYFVTVLSQVNRGRVAKDRVLAFLLVEAQREAAVREAVAALFTRLSLTLVHKDKAQLIKAMALLKRQYPDLQLPIETLEMPLAHSAQGVRHAG